MMAKILFLALITLILAVTNNRACPTKICSSSNTVTKSVSVVKTSSGEDIFDIFSKYNKDQLCAFYKKKNLSSIENLYLDYIKNTSDSTKLTAYKDALYKHYSKESSIDTVITELKEIVSSVTSSSSSSSSSTVTKSVSVVKTSSGEDIFDIFSKYNKDQLCAFYKKKNLSSIENLYLDYIKNTSDSTKLTAYKDALYKHYSKESSIDTVITELKEIVSSVTSSSSSSSSSTVTKSVSVVKTSSGEDIFDIFSKYNKDQLCAFYKKKNLSSIENLYLDYIKNTSDSTKLTAYKDALYKHYSKESSIDTVITELKEIVSSVTSSSSSSSSSTVTKSVSVVKTSSGEDIFDIFSKYNKDQLCAFYKKKNLSSIENLYLDYIKNTSDSTKLTAYKDALYKHYSKESSIDTVITELKEIVSSVTSSCSSSRSSTVTKSVSVVKTSSGVDIFDIFSKYNKDQLCAFYKKKNLSSIENLYLDYIKNTSDSTKLTAYKDALYKHYSKESSIDTVITELKEIVSSVTSSCSSSRSSTVTKSVSVVKTSSGVDIFDIFSKYNKDQLCAFYKKKNLSSIENLYLDYIKNTSDSTKLTAYKDALYKHYSKESSIDTVITELKEVVSSVTSSSSNSVISSCACR
ncbi:uncharacterized protein DDB_G0271670-like [Daktulosphaira vitifoliae]|uniref:uncharacterized protein DDB_G0271670-like n=1 Tax=Daktulosphaira vitifoliae TaxID=58002 RepID=UPI0021A9E186|nr:uncharacterized protein DDB_G0271670-like [Daktulosphaira vitifoliae]